MSALAVDPSNPVTLYAAIWSEIRDGGGGVYKSINAGATWNAVSTGIEEYNRELMSIAIAPSNSAVLYAGTDHGGVFKSTDGAPVGLPSVLGSALYGYRYGLWPLIL